MHKQDPTARLEQYILGETGTAFTIDSSEANRLVTLRMLEQARRTINITSRNLDPVIYDQPEVIEVLRRFAISSPGVKMRILINDVDPIVKRGHRLLELMRRLTSFIEIRVQGKTYREYNEALLLVDETGYIRRPLADRFEAEVCFAAPRHVREMNKVFEEMWQESDSNPNLRRLHI